MNELIKLLAQLSIPVIYKNSKRAGTKIPYGIYFRNKPRTIYTDNRKYFSQDILRLELYFQNLKEQLKIEKELEDLLVQHNYPYSKELDIEINDNISMDVYVIGGK